MKEAKYFVTSCGDAPEFIRFTLVDALTLGAKYIDAFDEDGNKAEVYEYDTKFGMHLVRLMLEGKELLETSEIKFPLKNKELLLDIRNGKYTKEEIIEIAETFEKEIESMKISVPIKPNYDWINEFLIRTVSDAHLFGIK